MEFIDYKPSTAVSEFLKAYDELETMWNFLYNEIENCQKKQEDLLHEIESTKFNVVAGFKKLMELQTLRIYRRSVKNKRNEIEPLYRWYQNNKGLGMNLHKIVKDVNKTVEKQTNWSYRQRYNESEDKAV